MVRLGKLPQFLVVPLVLVAVALFAGGLYFEEQTPIQTDPQQWVNQSSQTVKDLNSLSAQTNVSSELGVYTRVNGGPPAPTPGQDYVAPGGGVFTDQMGEFVTQLGVAELQRYPTELVDALSLATTVYYLSEVPGASQLYPTGEDLWQAYEAAPEPIQESMVAADGTAANLSFLVGDSSLEQRKVIVDDIRATVAPDGSIPAPRGRHRHPVGPGRDRRRAARQPHRQPPAAHRAGDRRGRRVAADPLRQLREGVPHAHPRAAGRRAGVDGRVGLPASP